MSSDPSVPVDPRHESGGYVIKNIMYNTNGGSDTVKVFGGKFIVGNTVSAEQYVIPPSRENMVSHHPCAELNRAVLRCNEKLSEEMRLAGRCAACNVERQALMKCMTQNDETFQKAERKRLANKPWWQLW